MPHRRRWPDSTWIAEAGDADVVVVHAQVAAIGRDALVDGRSRSPGTPPSMTLLRTVKAGDDVGVAVDAGTRGSGQQHLDHVEVIDGDVGAGVTVGKLVPREVDGGTGRGDT